MMKPNRKLIRTPNPAFGNGWRGPNTNKQFHYSFEGTGSYFFSDRKLHASELCTMLEINHEDLPEADGIQRRAGANGAWRTLKYWHPETIVAFTKGDQ